jgi:hypothetical protein
MKQTTEKRGIYAELKSISVAFRLPVACLSADRADRRLPWFLYELISASLEPVQIVDFYGQ